jgi:Fe-Mn family superoxide dismutase
MFILPDLPYGYDALEPVISARTFHFHHDKHHATYVKTVNELLEASPKPPQTLEQVILEASSAGDKKLFNNAAQAWNHTFFWEAMTAKPEPPPREIASAIREAFGDLAGLKTAMVKEGAAHFGSGWLWLVSDAAGKLSVRTTHDADDTLTHPGLTPLMVCDLWEHAYYLDYQNNRKGFLETWFDTLPDWRLAARQYAAAMGQGGSWRHPSAEAKKNPARATAG